MTPAHPETSDPHNGVVDEVIDLRKKMIDEVMEGAGALIEKHTSDHQSLLLAATAMFTVVQRCYEIALGVQGTSQFLRETADTLDSIKFH